jgi:hypothetical protein
MRRVYPIIILLVISAILVFALIPISNIIGPFRIHVRTTPQQSLELSAVNTPPGNISLGSTANITIRVRNPSSGAVCGYLILNVTASDFTVSSGDLSIEGRTNGWFGGYTGVISFTPVGGIPGGYMYRSSSLFTWSSNCDESATLYFTFNKANPTDTGYYEIYIVISSTPS